MIKVNSGVLKSFKNILPNLWNSPNLPYHKEDNRKVARFSSGNDTIMNDTAHYCTNGYRKR